MGIPPFRLPERFGEGNFKTQIGAGIFDFPVIHGVPSSGAYRGLLYKKYHASGGTSYPAMILFLLYFDIL
jgi:hypothetical protein